MSFQSANEMPCLSSLPKFYQEVLISYCKSKPNKEIKSKSELYNQLIWGIHLVTHDNNCLYSLNMINANVLFFKDILLPNEFDNIEFDIENKIFIKSKPNYELKTHKQLPPKSFNFWSNCFLTFSFETFYNNKLQPMHIAKIQEFLFKKINKISVCGELLFRWKIVDSKRCIYCDSENHTFKHMVFECTHCTNLEFYLY